MNMRHFKIVIASLVLSCGSLSAATAQAQAQKEPAPKQQQQATNTPGTNQEPVGDEDFVDFSSQITPLCEVAKLIVPPPKGWINVPIQTGDATVQGCQMMLIINEALIGVLRVLSFDLSNPPPDMPAWQEHLIGVESVLIHPMGYRLKEPIWQRPELPIAGAGFSAASAIGVNATIEGNTNPQEAHFIVFENPTHKYLISLLTPAESVDEGVYYQRNTQGMATVMQTFRAAK